MPHPDVFTSEDPISGKDGERETGRLTAGGLCRTRTNAALPSGSERFLHTCSCAQAGRMWEDGLEWWDV